MENFNDIKGLPYYQAIRRSSYQNPPKKFKIIKTTTKKIPNKTVEFNPLNFSLNSKRLSDSFSFNLSDLVIKKPSTASTKARSKFDKLILSSSKRPNSRKCNRKLNLSFEQNEFSPNKSYTFDLQSKPLFQYSRNMQNNFIIEDLPQNSHNLNKSLNIGTRKSVPFPEPEFLQFGTQKLPENLRPKRPIQNQPEKINPIKIIRKIPEISFKAQIEIPPTPDFNRNENVPKIRLKKCRMVSFGKNSDDLSLNDEGQNKSEYENIKSSAFSYLSDSLKPLFFFNINPGENEIEERHCRTPGFLDSDRDYKKSKPLKIEKLRKSSDESPKKSAKSNKKPKFDPSNIYINKTTIINNIISNAAKKKLENVSKIYTRNLILPGGRKGKYSIVSKTYNHV